MRAIAIALSLGFALSLAACTPPAAKAPAKAQYGAWGYDATAQDKSVKPGDDFFRYAIGNWVKTAQIPPDRTFAGVDLTIFDKLDKDVKAIIEEAGAKHAASGAIEQKIGDFYAAFADQAAIDKLGAGPLKADLAAIDNAADKNALGAILGALSKANGQTPVAAYVDIDPKDPTRYVPVLWQSGLSFGERDYYLQNTKDFVALRAKFLAHVEKLLTLAGYQDAKAQAQSVLALETRIAQIQWPPEKERQVERTVTLLKRADLDRAAKGLPLAAILEAQGLGQAAEFRVGMPDVLTKTAALYASAPLDQWKAYLRYQTLAHYGRYLSKPFDDEVFDFYSHTLRGQAAQRTREKRGVDLVNDSLGEAVGQIYVAKHFPASSKADAEALAGNLRAALAAKIDAASWMSESTKKEAHAKLASFLPKIGYPDKWKSYDSVKIDAHDLVADVKSAEDWAWNDQVSKLGKQIDRGEWLMTPQTDNAYYRPETNEITFPAAILQAPYFDPAADPAANYGAIGATMGHEMSHGFDDQGRKSDSTGKLRDWWTKADAKAYEAQAAKLVKQFNTYEPLPGLHIKGAQTLGENIADLAGLALAYDAYHLSLKGKEAPLIDGLTGDQRFFLAYAQSWETIYRPERMRDLLLKDVHSPAEYRVNGIVRNLDAWYAAFDVKAGDKLYLDPKDRVKLW